ncbi:hypothetical protein [Shewanella algae]|uniref:hypothetical protein n=1 Tax=Shewanella algae TaxID=38313 RepID=UPI0031F5727D
MTKSEIFKAAHEMARGTVKAVGNYQAALKLALQAVYSHLKNARPVRESRDRTNRFAKPVFQAPTFSESAKADYIKKNSRIVRHFASLADYNQAAANGNIGTWWNDEEVKGFYAYEYL